MSDYVLYKFQYGDTFDNVAERITIGGSGYGVALRNLYEQQHPGIFTMTELNAPDIVGTFLQIPKTWLLPDYRYNVAKYPSAQTQPRAKDNTMLYLGGAALLALALLS